MLRTYLEIVEFRSNCVWNNQFDYYDTYDNLRTEKNDHDSDGSLYDRIEESLLDWVKKNAKNDVYYRGDLMFEFASQEERDQLDAECGDPMAFKLIWT